MKAKPLQLDFHKQARAFPWLGIVLLLSGGLALVWQADIQEGIDIRKDQVERRAENVSERGRALDAKDSRVTSTEPASAEFAAIVSQQMKAPTEGLRLLEKTWIKDIAYLRIDVETIERLVKIDFEARDRETVLALVDAISKESLVERVTLLRQTAKQGDPFQPTQAQVEFWWKDAPR